MKDGKNILNNLAFYARAIVEVLHYQTPLDIPIPSHVGRVEIVTDEERPYQIVAVWTWSDDGEFSFFYTPSEATILKADKDDPYQGWRVSPEEIPPRIVLELLMNLQDAFYSLL